MLDDQAMEKKPGTRCSSQGAKGGSAETKFKQDAVSKFSRGPRRRESPSQRYEPPRKSNPQKSKTTIDKRPRPRGTINFGDRSEVVEDEILAAGASKATKPGSRKVNLNHLLNFTFASRETSADFPGAHRGHRSKVKLPRFNKEQFLQANCQFVVLEGGDYSVHSADPDTLVDWQLIQEVHLPCHEVPSCPICLYPATAAKMTRCGHIYCWACILHYLSLSDRSWSKCPICYEAIHRDDLKSVVSMSRPAPKVGEEVCLTLMRRERGSQFVVPALQWKDALKAPLSISDDGVLTSFQKLLTASREQILAVLQRERGELQSQLAEDNPEQCFIESALNLLQKREQDLCDQSRGGSEAVTERSSPNVSDEENCNLLAEENIPVTTVESGIQQNGTCHPTELETIFTDEEQTNVSQLEDDKQNGSYYFYQASDGQQVYMHSINARMLVKEYGSLRDCPPQITAVIMELETVTMTDALRKRLRYLQHLPLTCVFQVAELQLKQPLISQNTITLFNAEVQKRHRARSRKAREERRRDRHIELEQNKKIGKFPSARYSLSSLRQFPVCNSVSTDEDPPLETPEEIRSPSPASVSTIEMDADDASSTDQRPTSFAQMLRDGKARMEKPLSLESPTRAPGSSTATVLNSDGEEECAPAPDFHVTFGDALQAALSNMTLRNPDTPDEKKAGKRKKAKKTLLFTTSMSRSK